MKALVLFLKGVEVLTKITGVVSALLIFSAILITCQMVFVRYVLNHSTVWQTEVVTYMMIGATMIGLGYVEKLKGHVNVDLVPLSLKPKFQKLVFTLVRTAVIIMIATATYFGFEIWFEAYEKGWVSETVNAIPLAIPYAFLPVGLGVFLLQLTAKFLRVHFMNEHPYKANTNE